MKSDNKPIPPDVSLLERIERLAVELAKLAGVEIETSLGRELAVRYKTNADPDRVFADPVSEVDQKVEALIRDRLAERFPDHGILGEEMEAVLDRPSDFTWTIDPIDGTMNFVAGFPLFVASIGVLHQTPQSSARYGVRQPTLRCLPRPCGRPASV